MTKEEVETLPEVEKELYRVIMQVRINKCAYESFSKKREVRPKHALFVTEILPVFKHKRSVAELKRGLNNLCNKGIARFGRTINDIYFELTEYTDK